MAFKTQIGSSQVLTGWELIYILNLLDKRVKEGNEGEKKYSQAIKNKLMFATLGEKLEEFEIKTL